MHHGEHCRHLGRPMLRCRDGRFAECLGFCDGGQHAQPAHRLERSRHRNLFARNRGPRVSLWGLFAERAATMSPKDGVEQAVGTDKSPRGRVVNGPVGKRPLPVGGKDA